jgi:hypothetical protein
MKKQYFVGGKTLPGSSESTLQAPSSQASIHWANKDTKVIENETVRSDNQASVLAVPNNAGQGDL